MCSQPSLVHLELPFPSGKLFLFHPVSLGPKKWLSSFPWLSRSHPPGAANLLMKNRPNHSLQFDGLHLCTLLVVQMVASPSARLTMTCTSFIMLKESSSRQSQEWFFIFEDQPSSLALWFVTLLNGNLLVFLCYRIDFGGNPAHPITMAHVLGQISIEISMHPGVVSTCLVDKLMEKKMEPRS